MSFPYVLGLDSSTQSLSAVIVDRRDAQVVKTASISYKNDPRLKHYGLDPELMLLAPREPGEADQPPLLFLASLEALFTDLKASGTDLGLIGLINVSAQQHGHVFLSSSFLSALEGLRSGAGTDRPLVELLGGAFSRPRAPIWMTSNTVEEAGLLRNAVGGSQVMIALTGSDSPLRFTGAAARRVFTREQGVWEGTARLHLLSSFLPAVLTANPDVPADWGNGSGTSLMDFEKKQWSPRLLEAAAAGLTGGVEAFRAKLTPVASPLTLAGTLAAWFVKKYGFAPECRVLIGSGDNPQTKVLVPGDLLSLGTSFVMMVAGAGQVDGRGWGNAMYDGVGRPFLFGCRTNGALVWDRLRQRAGLAAGDFATPEAALEARAPGSVLALWQPEVESFPPSPVLPLTVSGGDTGFAAAYPGCVDSALGLLYRGSLPWLEGNAPLTVTGGPTASPGILRRIAAVWNRPVVTIGTTGAALGAAAAALAFDGVTTPLLPPSVAVQPRPDDVETLHRPGGYLDQLEIFLAEAAQQGEKR